MKDETHARRAEREKAEALRVAQTVALEALTHWRELTRVDASTMERNVATDRLIAAADRLLDLTGVVIPERVHPAH